MITTSLLNKTPSFLNVFAVAALSPSKILGRGNFLQDDWLNMKEN